MQNLLIIVVLMVLFGTSGAVLMKRYSFRTQQRGFMIGFLLFIVALLIALVLVLAYLDY